MASRPRFWGGNLIHEATLTPSSACTGNPVEALADQGRAPYWRTAVGWTITDHNNRLDFDIGGGEVTATIASGLYQTGAALAAAIVTALEAASAPPQWGCTYGVVSANKFNIAQLSSFSLLWKTGSNVYRSIGPSLGYDMTGDTTATNHLADNVSHQGQHFLVAALGSGRPTASAVLAHNVSATASGFRLETSASDSWTAPTLLADFTSYGDARRYHAAASAYLRLVVSDVSNPVGYFRLGVLYTSSYVTSPRYFSTDQSREAEDFSGIAVALEGSHSANLRSRRQRFSLNVAEVPDADADATLRPWFDGVAVGENRVLDLWPDEAADEGFVYGFLPARETETHIPSGYWSFGFQFSEAICRL